MSNARDIINGNEPSYGMKMYDWAMKNAAVYTEWGAANSQMIYAYARVIGWWVVTTGMITAVPLLFEVKREGMIEELERMQIGKSLSEGRTPQELAMEGLTGAIEPKVLN